MAMPPVVYQQATATVPLPESVAAVAPQLVGAAASTWPPVPQYQPVYGGGLLAGGAGGGGFHFGGQDLLYPQAMPGQPAGMNGPFKFFAQTPAMFLPQAQAASSQPAAAAPVTSAAARASVQSATIETQTSLGPSGFASVVSAGGAQGSGQFIGSAGSPNIRRHIIVSSGAAKAPLPQPPSTTVQHSVPPTAMTPTKEPSSPPPPDGSPAESSPAASSPDGSSPAASSPAASSPQVPSEPVASPVASPGVDTASPLRAAPSPIVVRSMGQVVQCGVSLSPQAGPYLPLATFGAVSQGTAPASGVSSAQRIVVQSPQASPPVSVLSTGFVVPAPEATAPGVAAASPASAALVSASGMMLPAGSPGAQSAPGGFIIASTGAASSSPVGVVHYPSAGLISMQQGSMQAASAAPPPPFGSSQPTSLVVAAPAAEGAAAGSQEAAAAASSSSPAADAASGGPPSAAAQKAGKVKNGKTKAGKSRSLKKKSVGKKCFCF